MIKDLLRNEKMLLDLFFDQVNTEPLEELVQIIKNCKGTIVLTGVGKSGLTAKKISVTLVSIGVHSAFLSPLNALHGDVGAINENDVVIILSKSGESDELLQLIPVLKNKKTFIVSIVFSARNRLVNASDFVVVLPATRELCPFDIIPTTSTTIQTIVGNILAITLLQDKKILKEQFALNHPAGRLGKRLILKVRDIMVKGERLPLCRSSDTIGEILLLLGNKRCGCVVAVDEKQYLEGIFTYEALTETLIKYSANAFGIPINNVMKTDYPVIYEEELVWNLVAKLNLSVENNPNFLSPIFNSQSKFVGLVRMSDIIHSGVL